MLISYNRPPDITPTLTGTGAAWISDDQGSALVDGSPTRATRIQWLSGAQTTSSVLGLRAAWATAIVPRVAGLVGLTLPVGTLVALALKRPSDTGYSYQTSTYSQRVIALPGGSRCVWFVLAEALDAIEAIEFQLINDVDGSASIAADSAFDVGELWVGVGAQIPHDRAWERGVVDPSARKRTLGGQLRSVPRRSWRSLNVQFAPHDNQVWSTIEPALTGYQLCAVITRWDVAADIPQHMLLGIATKIGAARHLGGPYFSASCTVEELPAAGQ